MVVDIGLVFGSANTAIFVDGTGIALFEPSAIAFSKTPGQNNIKAVGKDAVYYRGKSMNKIVLHYPVKNGIIDKKNSCIYMLKAFLRKLFDPKIKIHAIVGIPMGLNVEQRKDYEDCCREAGIEEVTLIENIILSAVGAGVKIEQVNYNFVVNMGAGTTEIAAISMSSINNGVSINIGGNMINNAIYESLIGLKNFRCGFYELEKIKEHACSLYNNDISSYIATGTDIDTSSPANAEVTAGDLIEVIIQYYLRIIDSVKVIIGELKPEAQADILKSGITVVGGASKIPGLDMLIRDKTNLRTNVIRDGIYSNILGAGKLITDKVLLKDILMQRS